MGVISSFIGNSESCFYAINELNKQGNFIRASQSNSDWLFNIKSKKC